MNPVRGRGHSNINSKQDDIYKTFYKFNYGSKSGDRDLPLTG